MVAEAVQFGENPPWCSGGWRRWSGRRRSSNDQRAIYSRKRLAGLMVTAPSLFHQLVTLINNYVHCVLNVSMDTVTSPLPLTVIWYKTVTSRLLSAPSLMRRKLLVEVILDGNGALRRN
jgi:hypothetical protein